jgi:hypothetical protein
MSLLHPIGIGPTHGRIHIYSAPKPVLSHINWSLNEVLGAPIELKWSPQPLAVGTWRVAIAWHGSFGAGARIASALRGWHYLRFEVYESALNGSDGSLFMFTPELGLYRANVGPHGDIMMSEYQVTNAISANLKESDVISQLERLLGKPWDQSLEPFRQIEIDGIDDCAGRISV